MTSREALEKFKRDLKQSPDKYGLIKELLARIECDEIIALWLGNIMVDFYDMEKALRDRRKLFLKTDFH